MPKDGQDIPQAALVLPRVQSVCAKRPVRSGTDLVALGIAVAAIIMLIGIGGNVVPAAIDAMLGNGPPPNRLLLNAFLLNMALVLLGWLRYRELTEEIADRSRAEEKARLLAETDALTGLLNRRSLGPEADHMFAEAAARGEAVAIVMLDLDKFKQVNDANGHAAGDTLLIEAANRLAAILPPGALLARIGGDEFACALPYSPRHPETIDYMVERLIDVVARPVRFAGAEIETTISAGVAGHMPDSTADARTVLHNADIAMYHAKKRGRNRHCWFNPAMEEEMRFRTVMEAAIRRGLANDEFVPFYQKQVDLQTGRLTGFEMLARWETDDLGHIRPDQFIPVAEEIGLIEELSEQLIRKALLDARDWSPELSLSVNISACQLRNPWFAQKLLKLLVEANFPANRLEIEITEEALMQNMALIRTMTTSLKNQGVRIILDDFGTGNSSLSRLRALPFDRLKIDRSLVATMNVSIESAAIVKSIISLGEGLGLPITAEGIETPEAMSRICSFGDVRGQGFLYGQPQSAQDMKADLAALGMLNAPAAARPERPVHQTAILPEARTA